MDTLIQITEKDGLDYIDDGGELYKSTKLRKIIATGEAFEFYGSAEDTDIYILERENVLEFLGQLKEVLEEQGKITLDKGIITEHYKDIAEVYKVINEVADCVYFNWNRDVIIAKLPHVEFLEI